MDVYVQGGTPVPVIRFWADRTSIKQGECVNISWHVENVKEVYYRGRPVVGENQKPRGMSQKDQDVRPDHHQD